MEKVINELASHLNRVYDLQCELNDKEYWINRAKEEAGFIPREGDWVHVEVTIYHIRISVYHKANGAKDAKYWLNGEWFNTPFPEKYPNL